MADLPVNTASKTEEEEKREKERSSLFALSPAHNAAVTIESYSKVFGEQNLKQLISDLQEQGTLVNNGDLSRVETMLIGQSHALQAIFMNLSRRAMNTEYIANLERYLRLALKGCRQ